MKFKVLNITASGNLLLAPLEQGDFLALESKHLFFEGRKVAKVADVIANAQKPFILAKPSTAIPVEGILETRR